MGSFIFPGFLPAYPSSVRQLPLRGFVPSDSAALLAPDGPRKKLKLGRFQKLASSGLRGADKSQLLNQELNFSSLASFSYCAV